MLKNVRFIERNAQPNRDMIKQADVVWNQVNALGHKHYTNIMDTARAHGVAVCYFFYASAEKCARQVAEEDRKIEDHYSARNPLNLGCRIPPALVRSM